MTAWIAWLVENLMASQMMIQLACRQLPGSFYSCCKIVQISAQTGQGELTGSRTRNWSWCVGTREGMGGASRKPLGTCWEAARRQPTHAHFLGILLFFVIFV